MKNILCLVFFLPSLIFGQLQQELRKEINVKENAVDFVKLVGEKGIISYGYRIERPDKFLEITAFDKDFKNDFSTEIAVPLKSYFSPVIYDDEIGNLYFVYADKKELTLVT